MRYFVVSAIVGTIIVVLALALVLMYLEAGGNTLGDSSMVPGLLVIGFIVVIVILLAGWGSGNLVIQVK